MARRYTPTEKAALVARYEAGETIAEIAGSLGRSSAAVNENLKAWGANFRRTGPARRHALQERYFSSITTEAQAYWLGFLFADGNVFEEKKVQIGLQRRDREHLLLFAQTLGFAGPIHDYVGTSPTTGRRVPMSHIAIHCAEMCRDLVRLGCVQQKTNATSLLPPTIRPALLRHFYRGYFDGDGCLCLSEGRRDFSMVGNPAFIAAAQDWLIANCGLTKVALITPQNCRKVRVVTYTGARQVPRIMRTLYAGATISLARKAALFKALIAQ